MANDRRAAETGLFTRAQVLTHALAPWAGTRKRAVAGRPGGGYSLRYPFSPGPVPAMNEVTRILSAIEQGDPHVAEQLLPLVYGELRKLAAQRLAQEEPGQTLQATALVHDAYLRLVDTDTAQHWNSRGHFFAAAAEAMRRILVEKARRKRRLKRGGGGRRVGLDALDIAFAGPTDDILALDAALSKLAVKHPEKAELVKLRFFAGLSGDEAARALGISPSTADRHWTFARAWLYREIAPEETL
jgi:RNA polymerase sigma factor (TIGR02999 family)